MSTRTVVAAGRVHANADRTCTRARTPNHHVHLCTDPGRCPNSPDTQTTKHRKSN